MLDVANLLHLLGAGILQDNPVLEEPVDGDVDEKIDGKTDHGTLRTLKEGRKVGASTRERNSKRRLRDDHRAGIC